MKELREARINRNTSETQIELELLHRRKRLRLRSGRIAAF